jgi:hypothetical protein
MQEATRGGDESTGSFIQPVSPANTFRWVKADRVRERGRTAQHAKAERQVEHGGELGRDRPFVPGAAPRHAATTHSAHGGREVFSLAFTQRAAAILDDVHCE